MNDPIKEYWDGCANEFGADQHATAPDHWYRQHEIDEIVKNIPRNGSMLDVGCGNGYSTLRFQNNRPGLRISAIDFSAPMIEAVPNKTGIDFRVGDVRCIPYPNEFFDCVVSERCVINLMTWEEQQKAILEMRRVLRPGGKLVLVENFIDGLIELNKLRFLFGLPAINVRWHNRYLVEGEFIPFAKEHFNIKSRENIGNLYYLMSRILYASMAQKEGKEPDYNHDINRIASMMPSLPKYQYSPNEMYILRRKP